MEMRLISWKTEMIPTNCSSLPELLAVLDLASLRPKAGQAGHVGTCVSSLGGYLGYIFAMFDSIQPFPDASV